MSTSEPIGRNEPCPCGSGQKYKLCCEGRQDIVQEARRSPWLLGGVAVVGLGVVATVAMQLGDPKPSDVSRSVSRPPTAQSPIVDPAGLLSPFAPPADGPAAPESTAPPGKVWSAEHGHYHDLPGAAASPTTISSSELTPIAPPTGTPGALTPAPEGPAPEGKVWSPEHGHYHDAPGAAATPTTISSTELTPIPPPTGTPGTLTPEPEGPAPEGKVWSPEHGHYHDAPAAAPVLKVEGGGEVVPIPPPAGTGATPSPTPAPKPADPTPPAPKPVDPPTPPSGTPPK